MIKNEIECDTVIIGAGSAGIEAFREASKNGRKCVLIDDGPLGTTAQRSGEIPTSILMSAGLSMHDTRRMNMFGIETHGSIQYDTSGVLNELRAVRARSTSSVLSFMYKIPEELRLRGRARFINQNSLETDDHLVRFKTAVVCTGASPRVTYEQSRLPGIITTDVFYEQKELPKSAAVFGSSSVGLQLGQALSYLGVDVMVFGQRRLWDLTDDAVLTVAHQMLSARFHLTIDSFITSIEADGDGYSIYYIDESNYENYLKMDAVIAATGRMPNVGGMCLQDIGIRLEKTGCIRVDEGTLQTSLPNIFAAGDVAHDRQSTSIAREEGKLAGKNARNYPQLKSQDGRVRLDIVYTDPVLAIVGHSLDEMKHRADASGHKFVISEVRLDNGHYWARHEEGGIVSLYTDVDTHTVMGAEICASGADHIAQFLSLIIKTRMPVEELQNFGFYHLSCEGAIAEAAKSAVQKLSGFAGKKA
ncbi:MAG: FAD-dependent oxidoreductase [Succinivibrio sp.]|nr:FAD-dependent oxidoreductase [Succinivibrio sp.]